MSTNTTNYNLQLYDTTDAPDLTKEYNTSMVTIDSYMKQIKDTFNEQIKTLNDSITALQNKVNTIQTEDFKSTSDTALTTSQLATAKIASNGTIYYVKAN